MHIDGNPSPSDFCHRQTQITTKITEATFFLHIGLPAHYKRLHIS